MIDRHVDIIIIGAGPAGLMAAVMAAAPDRKIVVLEKMHKPALKLRISGKGRCNITNSAPLPEFLRHFGKNGRFLKYAFSEFSNKDLLAFLKSIGIECKLERGGRYFPKSDKAGEIADGLVREAKSRGVRILTGSHALDITNPGDNLFSVKIKKGSSDPEFISADNLLIASGGKSYPRTGSTGECFELISKLGHTVTPLSPGLVPVLTEGPDAGRLQGLSLKNVNAEVRSGGRKKEDAFGEMVFTEHGVSGPIILSLSNTVTALLDKGTDAELILDLKPALDHKKVDNRLLREIKNNKKKRFRFLLKQLLPAKMIPLFLDKLAVPPDKELNQISADERKNLRILLKEFRMPISGSGSIEEALVTKGGVSIREINPQTMGSKLVPGLYFAGEVIDIDADTGGFNLQAAFSTGWVAGKAMKRKT